MARRKLQASLPTLPVEVRQELQRLWDAIPEDASGRDPASLALSEYARGLYVETGVNAEALAHAVRFGADGRKIAEGMVRELVDTGHDCFGPS